MNIEYVHSSKKSGVILGRPRVSSRGKSKLDGKKKEIQEFLSKSISKSSLSKILDCNRSTLNNFIKSRNL